MRILLEPSDYVLRNIGDVAMLRTAVTRLTTLWPNANIQVLSREFDALRCLCPNVTPLGLAGRQQWLDNDFIPGRLSPYLSPQLLRAYSPKLVEIFWRLRLRNQPDRAKAFNEFTLAVSVADLIMVTGMGGITDAFPEYASDLLEVLRFAVQRRKYVAMVGQGFGPLERPELVSRARAVLPRINFIALREERAGLPLLKSLGVAEDRVMTTGDDAIEMAFRLRKERTGSGLGINLRASNYSGVDTHMLKSLRQVLRKIALQYQAPMVAIPISNVDGEDDLETIGYVADGLTDNLVKGTLHTPEAVVGQLQHCRLVITGSYHAGVFALSTGIPIIGVAQSQYYINKFIGLSAQFGEGCQTVLLCEPDFGSNLEMAVARLWTSAERLRPGLLERALGQVQLGRKAYKRLFHEVEEKLRM
jgi:colanic acid/amylovoran biosynthesis protein